MHAFGFLLQAAAVAVNPSPSLEDFQRQIRDAYVAVEAEQRKMPPPANVSEQLIRLGAEDQAGRTAFQKLDFSAVPEGQRAAWRAAIFNEIGLHDQVCQKALKKLIPADGWFKISVYGKEAARSAFLIVQHAVNDKDFMRSVLAKLGELAREGEAEGQFYAMMYDRISLQFDQKPQLYGTQVACKDRRWQPTNLFEADKVNERRKAIGMTQTLEQYLTMFDDAQCL